MAREIELLTVRKVQQLSQPGRYRDGDGLYLQITRTGVKSWLLRYERAGRERWMGLGPERMVTLEEARGAAREAWKALNGGTDPIDARRAERAEAHAKNAKATTFAECVERYLTSHESKWRNPKHCAQVRSSLARY
ncbi:MAG TPA: Arm DNA-binding domain-containing protein, partial [Xanthobacteraceae bacterium]